ncbi:MAG TPA: MOSC domain-containing protein [Methylomirabilota bacterium]|nr:MOSC domain-containing protein [Methylomirabilota bacterium]
MSNSGRVVQINVSPGGVPKRPVESARVTWLGLEGDGHRDTEHHGGPERALCILALERIRELRAEGHPIAPGAIGENLTVEGLDWSRVVPGVHLLLADGVLAEVTRYTSPCFNITGAFKDGAYSRVSQKRHPGDSRVYARVLREGSIRRGDPVRLLSAAEAQVVLAPGRAT